MESEREEIENNYHTALRLDRHLVEGAASAEPANLALVESVIKEELLGRVVGVSQDGADRLAGGEVGEANDGDGVARLDASVVLGGLESKRKNALLLKVGLCKTAFVSKTIQRVKVVQAYRGYERTSSR